MAAQRAVPILLSLAAALLLAEASSIESEEDFPKFRNPDPHIIQVPPRQQRRHVENDDWPHEPQYRDPHIIDTLPRKPPRQSSRRTLSNLSLEEMCALLQQDKAENAVRWGARPNPPGSPHSTRRGMSPLLNIADKGLEFGKSMLYTPSLLFEPNAEIAKHPTDIYQDRYAGIKMDAEAALLENSPTLSTISSDSTDVTYSGPGSPYSLESPIIVTSSYKKKRDDDVTPRSTPRYPLPSRKPSFRIRPPYLMICISIIEITVHCLGDEATLRRWLVYDPRQRAQGWRFASYMLLHSNTLHLALNVVIQLVLATPLEVEQGRIGVATIYLGGGVCGALGASLLQPSLYLVGASAGIYALLTSHLAHLYLCHGELRYAGWRLGAVLLLAGADVASLPIPALLGCGRVGWAAHVAGALAGPLLGLAVFPNQSKKDARGRRFVRYVRLLSAMSVMLLIVGAVLGNVYLIALPQLRKPS